MKKTILLVLVLLSVNVKSQAILKTLVYSKGSMSNDARIVTLKEGNKIQWFSQATGWKEIPKQKLPDLNIVDLVFVQKPGMMELDTRLLVLLEDKSIWWYAEDKGWTNLSLTGLPEDKKVLTLAACMKMSNSSMMGSSYGNYMNTTRLVVTLDDYSLWFCAPSGTDSKWQEVKADE